MRDAAWNLRQAGATLGLVLGSGLGPFIDSLEQELMVPYEDITGIPVSKVPGHAGRFVAARVNGRPIIIAQGRAHLYEGWSPRQVTETVRFLHEIGVKTLILTNAAGAVNPAFPPGDWMMISDHINLTGQSPLHGGPNFIDMSEVYSKRLRHIFSAKASALGIILHEGIYAAMPGPQYETPAEIRMVRVLGADAVGMSTVPEAIQARALGIEVAAFSCLTNWGSGMSRELLNHQDVSTMGRNAIETLTPLLQAALPEIA